MKPNMLIAIRFCILWSIGYGCSVLAMDIANNNKPQTIVPNAANRPLELIKQLSHGSLKSQLQNCAQNPLQPNKFTIGHRGAPLHYPEHTKESYIAAAITGAGMLECDVTFTKDKHLVCRHSQCDLHSTTNILQVPALAAKCSSPFTPYDEQNGKEATAKCCTSDITLAEFKSLKGRSDHIDPKATSITDYLVTDSKNADLGYPSHGQLMTHRESITLFRSLKVKMVPELKKPEVSMPYITDVHSYAQQDYTSAMLQQYLDAGVPASDVWAQSFQLEDIRFWLAQFPQFADQLVYLDGRYSDGEFSHLIPASWTPSMDELVAIGVKNIAPPIWMLLTTHNNKIIPSPYALAAKKVGLNIIAWSFERSGSLNSGGGWYYQSVKELITNDGDQFIVLDVLAREIGVIGVFTDWPATTAYYINCIKPD